MWESGVDGMGLIKVDAEETEYEVLSEFDLALLGKVNGILGVFHGETSLDGSHNCVMVRKFY